MGSKTNLDNLNEINDDFSWMEFCTKTCHKMAKYVIHKITNGETVQKWYAKIKITY